MKLEAALTGNSQKLQDVLCSQKSTKRDLGDRKWAEPRIWQPDIWPYGKDQTCTSFWVAQINVFFVSTRKKKNVCVHIYIYTHIHRHIRTYDKELIAHNNIINWGDINLDLLPPYKNRSDWIQWIKKKLKRVSMNYYLECAIICHYETPTCFSLHW